MKRFALVIVALLIATPAFAQELTQTERRANNLIVELQRQNRVAQATMASYYADWQEALFQLGLAQAEIAELTKESD